MLVHGECSNAPIKLYVTNTDAYILHRIVTKTNKTIDVLSNMPPTRKGHLRPVDSDGHPNSVEKLASKYMRLCKVESSTEESDISPRSSDTSTMALGPSRQERRPLRRTLSSSSHKAGVCLPCYCRFLDPYDGSSEDSDESQRPVGPPSRRPRQLGGVCNHFLCRGRLLVTLQPPASPPPAEVARRELRASPTSSTATPSTPGAPPPAPRRPADVQMDSGGSSSERWVCGLDSPWSSVSDRSACWDPVGGAPGPEREEDRFEDSGLHSNATPPTPPPSAGPPVHAGWAVVGRSFLGCSGGSSESPPGPRSYGGWYKRKMAGPPGAEEPGQRKKRCVVSMEEEPGGGDRDAEMF